MQPESIKRALIIKIGAIGDAVMAFAFARELKSQAFEQITWLGRKEIAAVLSLIADFAETIIIDSRSHLGGSKLNAPGEDLTTWWRLRSGRAAKVVIAMWNNLSMRRLHNVS